MVRRLDGHAKDFVRPPVIKLELRHIIEPFSSVKGFINERFFFLQPSVLNGLTNFHVDPSILDYFGRKIFGMQTDSKTLIMQ